HISRLATHCKPPSRRNRGSACPQKLRAEGGPPTKQKPYLLLSDHAHALRGRAACDAPRRWVQSAAAWSPRGAWEPSGLLYESRPCGECGPKTYPIYTFA